MANVANFININFINVTNAIFKGILLRYNLWSEKAAHVSPKQGKKVKVLFSDGARIFLWWGH
jgi:hypothetical protein